MDIKLHIEDVLQKINNKKFDDLEIRYSKRVLNKLKKREDMKIYRWLIDAIFITYKASWKNDIITEDLNNIKNVVDSSKEKKWQVYDNISKKYARKNPLTGSPENERIDIEENGQISVDVTTCEFLLASNIVNNIIVVLNNEKQLDSSITLPISNMFESFDNFYTDDKIKLEPLFKSIFKLFSLNGWTASGFKTSPNRTTLALGLKQILDKCK